MPLDAEETKKLGSLLRQTRTQKGLSLESVQQRTRIPRKFLEALEENRFEDFPAPVYLRGFLHTYCEFLDLEFDQVWPLAGIGRPVPQPDVVRAPAPEFPKIPAAALAPAAAFAVVVGLGLWFAARKPAPRVEKTHERPPLINPVTPAAAAPVDHVLSVTFTGRAWLRLVADDEVKFEGRAPAGVTREWRSKQSFRIRTPSPENVQAVLDGKAVLLAAVPLDAAGDYLLLPSSAPFATAP